LDGHSDAGYGDDRDCDQARMVAGLYMIRSFLSLADIAAK